MQLLRELWFMLEKFHYFVSILVEISKLLFAFNGVTQLFPSDIVPSSLMNFEIYNSILRFSIFSQTVQF